MIEITYDEVGYYIRNIKEMIDKYHDEVGCKL